MNEVYSIDILTFLYSSLKELMIVSRVSSVSAKVMLSSFVKKSKSNSKTFSFSVLTDAL